MKKKRLISMMTATAMIASLLAGCGNNEPSKVTESSSTTKTESSESAVGGLSGESSASGQNKEIPVDAFAGTELEIAVYQNPNYMGEDYNDMPAMKAAEEATGIHINWVPILHSVSTEQTNIMLASNELPDAMIGLVSTSQVASNLDLFYDISEEGLLETYAPNVYADIEQTEGGLSLLTWSDGSIRTLPTNAEVDNYGAQSGAIMWMNKNWLEQLNMEIPTTTEEFYNVLCAFRDNDMNGNGDKTDEIPFGFGDIYYNGQIYNLAGWFGIGAQNNNFKWMCLKVEDGQVLPTVDTEQYRAFLEYTHTLAAEGLLDLEGFSQTLDQYKSKVKDGLMGCFYSWAIGWITDKELASQYVPIKPIQALEGVEAIHPGTKNKFGGNLAGFAISADCENVEALLHWWNYLNSSTEMKWTATVGEQGIAWDFDEDGNVVSLIPSEHTTLPEGWIEVNYYYTNGLNGGIGPYLRKDEMSLPNQDEPRVQAVNMLYDMMIDVSDAIPSKVIDPAKDEERSFIETELMVYLKNFFATSIMNGVTDQSWEEYLGQLETYQYYDWIEWYQGYLDGDF